MSKAYARVRSYCSESGSGSTRLVVKHPLCSKVLPHVHAAREIIEWCTMGGTLTLPFSIEIFNQRYLAIFHFVWPSPPPPPPPTCTLAGISS